MIEIGGEAPQFLLRLYVKGILGELIKQGSSTEIQDGVSAFKKFPRYAHRQKGFSCAHCTVEINIPERAVKFLSHAAACSRGDAESLEILAFVIGLGEIVKILLFYKLLQMGLTVQELDLPAPEAAAFLISYIAGISAERAFVFFVEVVLGIAVFTQEPLFLLGDLIQFGTHR